jgi:hypothetical protein
LRFFLYLAFFILINLNAQEEKLDLKFFGTLGGVYNDNSDYIFRKNPFQKDGSTADLDLYTDSILGLQTTYKINDDFSLIAQGVVKKDFFGQNEASIDWGYLKYDSNENFIVKIGKIRTPYYKNSNNQNIGYSKLMIREPIEVYGQIPLSTYNGIEFIYSNIIDKYYYSLQANYGQETFDTPLYSRNETLTTEIKEVRSLSLSLGNDIIEARGTYLYGRTTTSGKSLNQLFSSLKQTNIKYYTDLAAKYEMDNKVSQYYSLGIFVDYNDFIFSSEYGQRQVNAFYANVHGFYTTLGYRFSSFTPYISYAEIKMDEETSINSGVPQVDELIKVQNLAQSSNTIGFKYHINQNLDFKFEYQRIKPKGEYGGFYIDPTDEYPNSTSHVYSFVIDFVF